MGCGLIAHHLTLLACLISLPVQDALFMYHRFLFIASCCKIMLVKVLFVFILNPWRVAIWVLSSLILLIMKTTLYECTLLNYLTHLNKNKIKNECLIYLGTKVTSKERLLEVFSIAKFLDENRYS
uniref:Uncharacterized protein n=1 Tax=Cacopsylla melanoneura TaxID=428564 RepID=A0A8D8TZL9_9HEMI